MARLVSILILEEGEHEVIQPEFTKSLERSGDFKVLQFNRMDIPDSDREDSD